MSSILRNLKDIASLIEHILSGEYSHISLWGGVALLFGILSYFYSNCSFCYWHLSLFVVLLLSQLFLKGYPLTKRLLLIITVSFYAGILFSYIRVQNIHITRLEHHVSDIVSGTIESLHPIDYGIQIILTNLIIFGHMPLSADTKIRLNIPHQYNNDLVINDEIMIKAKILPPPSNNLGYNFAFISYFNSIGGSGSAKSKAIIINKHKDSLYSKVQKLRYTAYKQLNDVFSSEVAGFVSAILLGEGRAIDKNIMSNIRYSGISHLLCISGLHISLVAAIFFKSSRFVLNIFDCIALRYNVKIIAASLSFFVTILYWLLTDMQIACTRAFIMNSIVIYATILGRKLNILRSLLLAFITLLIFNPEDTLSPSFQLSFIAVLSLLLANEAYTFLKSHFIINNSITSKVKIYFFQNIWFSLLVNFVTAPVSIYNFHNFSNYSIVTNFVAVPVTLFLIIPLIIIYLPFLCIDYRFSYIINLIEILIKFILQLSEFVVALPGAVSHFGYITQKSLIVYLLGFLWLAIWRQAWRFIGVGLIIIAIILMFNSPKPIIIFNYKNNVLAVKTEEEKLKIFATNPKLFAVKYLSNWFGQNKTIFQSSEIFKQNWFFNYNNKKIALLFNDNYSSNTVSFDLVINTQTIPHRLNAKDTISRSNLDNSQSNNILIFDNKADYIMD